MNMKKYVLKIKLVLILVTVLANTFYVAAQPDKDMVIAQMNYCINTLTNIIHNKSMTVLEHESDQLLNNLTMEQIIGLYEINEFRVELLDAVSRFEITEEERALLRRLQSIKRDNMKWAAISNALDPTMLLTGSAGPGMGYQLAFQALLTAARSAVEYKVMQGEQNIEELRAMWDLRKEDLKTINEVRKTALSIVFSLYNKYHLSENDRLTEATANLFSDYISEPDAAKRVRLLEDHRKMYEHMPDFYYHLGMGYVDLEQYDRAKPNFETYLELYGKAPILRYDEKSGCIALTRLTCETDLTNAEKRRLIDIALQNLPGNSAAILQCAMVYLYELEDAEKGLDLIRAGIDDPNASDHNLDISEVISFGDVSSQKWYLMYLYWMSLVDSDLNDELHIVLPERISYNIGDIFVYIEEYKDARCSIQQLRTMFSNGVTIDEIEDVDCFKANRDLKYLFFETLVPDKVFILKRNIDYEKIRKEEWPRMTDFYLSNGDIEDIVDFCENNSPESYDTDLVCERWGGKYVDKGEIDGVKIRFAGDSLRYDPCQSVCQEGVYLRIVFANGINLMYRYDSDDEKLKPYLYIVDSRTVIADEKVDDEIECLVNESDTLSVNNSSWWSKVKTDIRDVFSSEDEKDTLKAGDSSWWSKTRTNIRSIFSKEDINDEDAVVDSL